MKQTYQCAPEIVWVKNTDHLLLINQVSGQQWTLDSTPALIWELLNASTPAKKIVPLLTHIEAIEAAEAAAIVQKTVQKWQQDGLVRLVEAAS